jgi:hypothetical protein
VLATALERANCTGLAVDWAWQSYCALRTETAVASGKVVLLAYRSTCFFACRKEHSSAAGASQVREHQE